MTRLALRRRPAPDTLPLPLAAGLAALGLAAGALAGFLVGELWGPSATRAMRNRQQGPAAPRRSVAELVEAAHTALLGDAELAAARLDAVPVGRGALELHGWVPDRRARARALRLVRAAVPNAALVDCLRVRGEDDLALAVVDPDARSA